MGIKRNLVPVSLCIALLLNAGRAIAADVPNREWTPLPDPNAGFVPLPEPHDQLGGQATLDQAMEGFDRAVAQSIKLDRQAIEAACKVVNAAHAAGPRVSAWQANCRYIRR